MTRMPGSGRPEISAGQWQRVEALLPHALELPPDARRHFLDNECAGDAVLRAELESLVAAHEGTGPLDRKIVRRTGDESEPTRAQLAAGTVVSHYEIQECLGSGGMGVVYRARDLRLGRTVALKFLPPRLSGDAHAKKRFLTEARAAAALQHANVCTVHEISETDEGQLFIAMAFVEGESLRDLIERGPLPIAQAVDITRQIARGLECAHEHGIVHRDVKPANVMLGADRVVRLVDFGVAKLAGSTVTNAGVTPGTAAYMAPEQVRGETVDHRADLWALGVVLYEMLAGRRPFPGETDAVVLHAITTLTPPNVRTLRADVPMELDAVVSRALERERDARYQSVNEFRDALRVGGTGAAHDPSDVSDIRFTPNSPAGTTSAEPARMQVRTVPSPWKWAAAGALALSVAGGSYVWLGSSRSPPGEVLRVSIFAPGLLTPQLSVAISPTGRQVAFVSTNAAGKAMLWVRALDQLEARPVPGTDRAAHQFWSPDGRSLGFIADNQLKRVDLTTGLVQVVTDSVLRWGPAWGPDGTILFTRRRNEIAAVPATGGPVTTVARVDSAKEQTLLLWPRFLPDGRHFIYYADGRRPEYRGIYVGSLDSKETKFLLQNEFRAWYAPPGYLMFPRDETLMAQRFDPTRLELHGEPVAIADGVWFARPAGHSGFSVSETGALAYINASLWDGELSWFDRTGRPVGAASPPVRNEGLTPQISPDGRRVAIGRGEYGRESVWIVGASGESTTRLSSGIESGGSLPVWAANGRRVMYRSGPQLIVTDVDSGTEQIVRDSVPGLLQDWSRDGQFVVFQRAIQTADLWVAKLDGKSAAFPWTQTPYNETQAQFSPDGKWIAYSSNQTGRDEVYVQAFPGPGRKRQVSTDGGAMPRWRRDGTELFYVAANQFLTAVPIVDSRTLEFGRPLPLFRTRLVVEGSESITLQSRYDVAPGGDRFLFRYLPVDPGPPITVVINWTRALRR